MGKNDVCCRLFTLIPKKNCNFLEKTTEQEFKRLHIKRVKTWL